MTVSPPAIPPMSFVIDPNARERCRQGVPAPARNCGDEEVSVSVRDGATQRRERRAGELDFDIGQRKTVFRQDDTTVDDGERLAMRGNREERQQKRIHFIATQCAPQRPH